VTPPAGALLSLRQALIKSTPEPEKEDTRNVDEPSDQSYKTETEKARSQAEQIAWIAHQIAAKGKH
jgi:hypothetical protein